MFPSEENANKPCKWDFKKSPQSYDSREQNNFISAFSFCFLNQFIPLDQAEISWAIPVSELKKPWGTQSILIVDLIPPTVVKINNIEEEEEAS